MKGVIAFVFSIFACCCSYAQDYNQADSLLKVLAATKNDTSRVWALHDVAFSYLYTKPDSTAWYAQQELALSKQINYDRGEIRSLNDIGIALLITGNSSEAIQVLLEALEKAEQAKDEALQSRTLGNIAEAYNNQGDNRQAVNYALRSLANDAGKHDTVLLIIDYENLSNYYEQLNQTDSALTYANKAYQLHLQRNDVEEMGLTLNVLGNIQSKLGNEDLALPYYRKAILANVAVKDYYTLSRTYYSIAELFKRTGHPDSTLHYMQKAYQSASLISDKKGMLDASSMLSGLFGPINRDSTIKYLKANLAMKDSIFNQEKVKQLQSVTINEQLRQTRISEEKEQAAEERRKNIQMVAIGAFIPVFLGLVLLISKRKVKPRTIQFMGLLGLLLLFEFISLFLHPYIEKWTHHTPIFMLLILVVLASILVPMHHRMEHWVKGKLAKVPLKN